MRLLLHIGNHKTGSSAIQSGLEENHEALLKYGALYPRAALITCAHHNLSFSVKGQVAGFESKDKPKSLRCYRDEIISEAQKNKVNTVIVSSEDFMRFCDKDILEFSSFTKSFDEVKVIVYLRNHINLIESGYKFEVLWKVKSAIISFKEYLESNLNSEYHEYDKRIEPWLMLHDNINVAVKNYHSAIEEGLIASFFKEIDADYEYKEPFNDDAVNSSLTRLGTLLLRSNNREKKYHRQQLIQKIRLIEAEDIFSKKEMLYTPEQFQEAVDRFKISNQKLKNRFGIDLNVSVSKLDKTLCCGEKYTDSDMLKMMEIGRTGKINTLSHQQ